MNVQQVRSNMADAGVYSYGGYDIVIDNSGSLSDLKKEAEEFVKKYSEKDISEKEWEVNSFDWNFVALGYGSAYLSGAHLCSYHFQTRPLTRVKMTLADKRLATSLLHMLSCLICLVWSRCYVTPKLRHFRQERAKSKIWTWCTSFSYSPT